MKKIVIQTKNLTKRFGKAVAVDGIDLVVPEGSVYGFLGPNGAGKTTTIRMILGLSRASAGEISVFGKDAKMNRKEILKGIGALVESPSIYPSLTAEENLNIVATILGVGKDRVKEVLKTVGLENTGKKKAGKFSLGMKQRLGLAFALLNNPKLLILDEPSNGLDPQGIIEMRNLIKSLPKKGITVFLSSHLLSEVEQIVDNIGVINNGKLLFQGTIDELKNKQELQLALKVDDFDKTAALLKKNKYTIIGDKDGSLLVPIQNNANIPDINSLLVKAGIKVFSLAPNTSSLEDIFINLTDGK